MNQQSISRTAYLPLKIYQSTQFYTHKNDKNAYNTIKMLPMPFPQNMQIQWAIWLIQGVPEKMKKVITLFDTMYNK